MPRRRRLIDRLLDSNRATKRSGAARKPLNLERLESRVVLYATQVHAYLAGESIEVFEEQFGTTALTPFNAVLTAATIEEDEAGENPFNETFPFNRHFWGRTDADPGPGVRYVRDFFDGLAGFDSAPNRAVKYFTGGIGLNGVRDGSWSNGTLGAVDRFDAADFRGAAEFVGHALHLLQDMSVPAHVHNDEHPPIPFARDDHYHEYVDGSEWSTGLFSSDLFDDNTPTRWTTLGRAEDVPSDTLRSPESITAAFAGTLPDRYQDVNKITRLYFDTASLADDFDSTDEEGETNLVDRTDGWTKAELDLIADLMVPRAIRDGAELLRTFFATVDVAEVSDPDSASPFVDLPKFTSTDPLQPQVLGDPRVTLLAVGTDQDNGDSGIGKDLFKFEFTEARQDGTFPPVWTELIQGGFGDHFTDGQAYGPEFAGKHGAESVSVFNGEVGKTYRFRVTAEDGAGNTGESETYYVRVGEPEVSVVTVLDVSGSMRGLPLTNSRIAAQDFVGLLNDFDDIGVVSFNSSAQLRLPLTEITPGSDVRGQAQSAIGSLSAGGLTSIGAGLLTASQQLAFTPTSADEVRSIIVLSDGQENTAPFVRDVLNQIDPSIAIYGIALGSGADSQQLQEVTNERMGEFFSVPDMASLGPAFARLSGVVGDEQDVLRSDGVLTNGQESESTFTVDPDSTQITTGLQWPGSDFDLTVISPSGVTYRQGQLPASARFIGTPTSEFIKIDNPDAGVWRAVVRAIDVDPTGERFDLLARVVSPVKGRVLPGPDVIDVGATLDLQVLLSRGAGLSGATVTGSFVSQDNGSATPIEFFDDGMHNDGVANDGIYGGSVLAGTSGSGAYELLVDSQGTLPSGEAFVRTPSRVFFITGSGVAGGTIGGYVYLDVNNNGLFDAAERPLPNVTITLDGPTTRITTTNVEGFYSFNSLPAGDYTVEEEQPLIFLDGIDTPGTPALGAVGDDAFVGLTVGPGTIAFDYNFGEYGLRPEMISKRLLLNSAPALSVVGGNYVVSVDTNVIPFRPSASTSVVQAVAASTLVGLQVYDANLMPVSFSSDHQRLALALEPDEPYLLVSRTSTGVSSVPLAVIGSDGTDLTSRGDFDHNGLVDDEDKRVWRSNYGSTGASPADANGDGVVNAADYTVWRDNRGQTSLAYNPSAIVSSAPQLSSYAPVESDAFSASIYFAQASTPPAIRPTAFRPSFRDRIAYDAGFDTGSQLELLAIEPATNWEQSSWQHRVNASLTPASEESKDLAFASLGELETDFFSIRPGSGVVFLSK